MARTKSTARIPGKGPGLAATAARASSRSLGVPLVGRGAHVRKGKPMSLLQQKSKRLKHGAGVLKEIRKQQKAVGFAIPKAPFQRLVRDICDG